MIWWNVLSDGDFYPGRRNTLSVVQVSIYKSEVSSERLVFIINKIMLPVSVILISILWSKVEHG